MPKAICTFLENVDSSQLVEGVENFYFLSDIFDFMLDLIQTEARLLHMLLCWTLSSSSDTLTIPGLGTEQSPPVNHVHIHLV